MLENIGRNVNRDRKVFYPQTVSVTVKPRFVLEGEQLRLLPLPFETRRDAIQAAVDGSILELLREGEYWAGDDPLLPFSNIARILAFNRAWARRDTALLWKDPSGEPFQVTLALLQTFYAEALQSGAERAVVLIFPAKSDLVHLAHNETPYWVTLLQALRERAIPYIDLSGDLARYERENDTKAHKIAHLTRRGNGVVAQRTLRWLRE